MPSKIQLPQDSEGDLTMNDEDGEDEADTEDKARTNEVGDAKNVEVEDAGVRKAEKRNADKGRSPEATRRKDGDHDWDDQRFA